MRAVVTHDGRRQRARERLAPSRVFLEHSRFKRARFGARRAVYNPQHAFADARVSLGDGGVSRGEKQTAPCVVFARERVSFERGERGKIAGVRQLALDDPALESELNDGMLYEQLLEDAEVLDELTPPLELPKVMRGEQTPVFFGSAMTNFGVQLFLDTFMDIGAPPIPRALDAGDGENAADFQSG